MLRHKDRVETDNKLKSQSFEPPLINLIAVINTSWSKLFHPLKSGLSSWTHHHPSLRQLCTKQDNNESVQEHDAETHSVDALQSPPHPPQRWHQAQYTQRPKHCLQLESRLWAKSLEKQLLHISGNSQWGDEATALQRPESSKHLAQFCMREYSFLIWWGRPNCVSQIFKNSEAFTKEREKKSQHLQKTMESLQCLSWNRKCAVNQMNEPQWLIQTRETEALIGYVLIRTFQEFYDSLGNESGSQK